MKKFRVAKVDGTYEIIEATNMENAITIARNKFGQLPNDINNKIVTEISHSLLSTIKDLDNCAKELRMRAKEMDWNTVYSDAHKLIERLNATSMMLEKQVGSMVKVNKEEN